MQASKVFAGPYKTFRCNKIAESSGKQLDMKPLIDMSPFETERLNVRLSGDVEIGMADT